MLSLDATVHLLWLGTPILAGVSGVTVLTAVSGDSWLKTQEKVPNPAYRNGSSKIEYISKWTTSGLFTLCVTEGGQREFHCTKIDYFPTEEYNPDPNDSTQAIPYTVLRSVGFFLTAAVLLATAELLCINGHCCRRRRYFTFLAGISFVVAGLFMMLGIVIYIATLKGEVAEKLRPKSTFQEPLFVYAYGWSFLLIIAGFISTEVAGITAIFLYIYWHKRDWSKKQQLLFSTDCIPPPPPACLKHPRQRSFSFHAQMPQPDNAHVRRTRSQQYLECPESCQNHVERPSRISEASSVNHISQNHVSPSRGRRNPDCLPPPLALPPSTPHRVSYPSSPHPQRYAPHPALVDVGFGAEEEGEGGFEWREREAERERRRRMGRSLTNLMQKEGCDGTDNPFTRSGTLPRSHAKLSAAPPLDAAHNASTSSSSYTMSRGPAKGGGAGPHLSTREEGGYPPCGVRVMDHGGNPAPFPRVHRSRSGPIPILPMEGSGCGIAAGCCSCCSCYCCCCCWRDGAASSTPPCPCAPQPRPRMLSLAPAASWGAERWHEETQFLLPRSAPCPASCNLAHFSSSSPNLKYCVPPGHAQPRPPPRQVHYAPHYYRQVPAHPSRPHPQYYTQQYRHEGRAPSYPQHPLGSEGRARREEPHNDPRLNDPRHNDPRVNDPRMNDPRHKDPHRHTTPV